MKKLLLFAAAAVAFGASAQTLTQTWKVETANNLPVNECRQGVGLNGKIYVNNKSDQKVYVVDKDGVSATTLPGGANCGIGHDQAGNLLVSNAVFPNKWADDAVIKVYNPQTPETVTEITITADLAAMGRSDFLGSACLLYTSNLSWNGRTMASIAKSNFTSIDDVVRLITTMAGKCVGLAKLTIRNKTQG